MFSKIFFAFLVVGTVVIMSSCSQSVEPSPTLEFAISEEVLIVTDYSSSLGDAVEQSGKYSMVRADINDVNFPVSAEVNGKKVSSKMATFTFDRNHQSFKSEEVIAEMNKWGFRPANLRELLAASKTFNMPVDDKVITIIALGSAWQSKSPEMAIKKSGLVLELDSLPWLEKHQFLAVKK